MDLEYLTSASKCARIVTATRSACSGMACGVEVWVVVGRAELLWLGVVITRQLELGTGCVFAKWTNHLTLHKASL